MAIELLNSLTNEIGNLRDKLINEYNGFVVNKNNSLEDRWQAFELVYKELPTELYGNGFIDELGSNVALYDDFYVERHETVSYKDMWDRIRDYDEYSEEVCDHWRECVLASGDGSFRYDW